MNPGEVVVYKCKGMFKVEDVGTLNFSFVDRRKKYYTLQSLCILHSQGHESPDIWLLTDLLLPVSVSGILSGSSAPIL